MSSKESVNRSAHHVVPENEPPVETPMATEAVQQNEPGPPLTIAESLKQAAEEVVQQSGFVYDKTSGLYYDYNSGYYYDAVSVGKQNEILLYHVHNTIERYKCNSVQ